MVMNVSSERWVRNKDTRLKRRQRKRQDKVETLYDLVLSSLSAKLAKCLFTHRD